jgi:hypothetical protein
MRVIGIDCATEDARVGIALGDYRNGKLQVRELSEPLGEGGAVKMISRWLKKYSPALLAIDAPLGWPTSMGESLSTHIAGARITAPRDDMFRRATDVFVRREIKKTPLDVGADRIARTAHAALEMLDKIRRDTGLAIPLAWEPKPYPETVAIEVYPAATLAAHGFTSSGYKKDHQRDARQRIVDSLQTLMSLPHGVERMLQCPDVLDATVCLLAGKDFLDGHALPPEDLSKATREGWIWVRHRHDASLSLRPQRVATASHLQRAQPESTRRRTSSGDVIRVMPHLKAADVAGRRVLCPACNQKIFESWPLGWDAHAHSCVGVKEQNRHDPKSAFKARFRHLFR